MSKLVQYRSKETMVRMQLTNDTITIVLTDEYDSETILATFAQIKHKWSVRLHDDVKIQELALE